jgi:hypothetical protein
MVCVCLLSAAGPAVGGEKMTIQPKWKAGQTHYLEFVDKATQKAGLMSATVGSTEGVWEKVDKSSAEGTTITWSYDRSARSIEQMGQVLSFDTDMPEAARNGDMLKPMSVEYIGMPLKLDFDGQGRCTSLTGMSAILDKIAKSAGANPIFAQFRAGISDERVRHSMVDERMALYPDKPVAVGDSWEKSIAQTNPQVGGTIATYTIKFDRVSKENGREMAVLTYDAVVKPDPAAKGKPNPTGMVMGVAGGSVKGTASFDPQLGAVVKQEEETRLTIEARSATASAPDAPPLMTIEVNSTRAITLMNETQRKEQKAINTRKNEDARKAREAAASDKATPSKGKPRTGEKPGT